MHRLVFYVHCRIGGAERTEFMPPLRMDYEFRKRPKDAQAVLNARPERDRRGFVEIARTNRDFLDPEAVNQGLDHDLRVEDEFVRIIMEPDRAQQLRAVRPESGMVFRQIRP